MLELTLKSPILAATGLIVSVILFALFVDKAVKYLKKDYKWALFFVPLSFLFDIFDKGGHKYRLWALFFAGLTIVFSVWLALSWLYLPPK